MSTTQAAYSTTDTVVLETADRMESASKKLNAELAQMRTEFGCDLYLRDAWSRRTFAGFLVQPLVEGVLWRRIGREGYWWPKQTTKAGKELHTRFEALGFKWEPLPGMPPHIMADLTHRNHGWFQHNGTVWVSWSASHDYIEMHAPKLNPVDLTIWQRQPLSAYYAAKEAAA